HEANVLAGRTNVMLARHVQRVGVTFQETIAQFPAGKAVLTGMPLRTGIVAPKAMTPQKARGAFAGLETGRFTVLVIGGSQGARAHNACILEAAARLLEAGAQILHQTGVRNFEA